jgi:hypothetical protein
MSSFFFKEVSAEGQGKRKATINLINGVNIICGPSNTGKSHVLACVDYIFGAEDVPFQEALGYNNISATLVTDTGFELTIDRPLEKGKTKATIHSDHPSIKAGSYSYSDGEMSQLFLGLIGIEEPHRIISTKKFKTANLTWRVFWHVFSIDEGSIFKKDCILKGSPFPTLSSVLSSLRFLVTGTDEYTEFPKDDKDIQAAKKKAVIDYINKKVAVLSEQNADLNDKLLLMPATNIEKKIQDIMVAIDDNERKIIQATNESRALLENIYEASKQIEEAIFLQERYASLKTQYLSDIQRLEFIINGEQTVSYGEQVATCPFCESSIECQDHSNHAEASAGELERIKLQLKDLQAAENEIESEISELEQRLCSLHSQNSNVMDLINTQFNPRISELKTSLAVYSRALQWQGEMEAMRRFSVELNADAFQEETSEEDLKEYEPRDFLTGKVIDKINDYIDDMLRNCAFPGYISSRLSVDSCDLVVNGKKKKMEGKGYRAFLNSVLAFVMMKYLSLHAIHAPRLLVLDSPILSLLEKNEEDEEMATEGMKASLFRYMFDNQSYGQIIIAENEIPNLDYSNANVIRFTKDPEQGRYGFLYDIM